MTFSTDNQCPFSRKYNSLRPVIVARCTPLRLVALHCKLGEIFLLKILRHKKSRKWLINSRDFSSILCDFQPIFVGISVCSWALECKNYLPMQKFLKIFPRTSSVEILLACRARTIVGGGLKSSKILPAKEICIAIQ